MSIYDFNRPTPAGFAMGEQTARMCDLEVKKLIAQGECECDQRCVSCAFLAGTVPNGCEQTQMDAIKSVLEHNPFFCHMAPQGTKVCAGWFAAVQAVKNKPKVTCPWPYSEPDPK